MNSVDFTYWLKGFLVDKKQLSTQELNQIKEKIAHIVIKVTPTSKDSAEKEVEESPKEPPKAPNLRQQNSFSFIQARSRTYC